MTAANLLHGLHRIYPPGRLLTQPAQLAPYESDALTFYKARPRAVVLAESQEEVVATVRLCYDLQVPFVARGSGTSLSGGSLPLEDGIVIGLNRLNRILTLDPESRVAVVEPGVINLAVSQAAAPHNLYFAPDPASQSVCTIGGNIAFNSGGVHCLKYGMTSNHVLGLKVVLADGEVAHLGGDSLEGVGPDVTGLFVGSEGLFGIALEATLRLIARVESYRTVLAAYRTLEEAGNAVSMVVASGLLPGALEIMDRLAIKATEEAAHAGYPLDAGGLLIVELEGEAVQVEHDFARLLDVIQDSGAYQVRPAQGDAERALIWKGRKGAFSAVGRLSPQYIVQDGVVPRGKLGTALAEIERLSLEYGIAVANVFHAGDGNLHPLVLYDARKPGEFERAEEMASQILNLCIGLGGSITGEHGVGVEKRRHLPAMYDEIDMITMQRLRQAMDPIEIANRGKMLPLGRLPAIDSNGARGERATRSLVQPATAEEVVEAILDCELLVIRGRGTKPALTNLAALEAPPGPLPSILDLSRLQGIIDYVPDEFTFTARAGTPVVEVVELLAQHGQYLPFDPPLSRAGATLGGTVAAGLSGPRRYRYGGVRDFILGTRFVDGLGQVVYGGGKVVKNAAGFDLPKLLVGSLGRLGALVELTFKVFPQPPAFATLRANYTSAADALNAMIPLTAAPLDLEAVDLEPLPEGAALWLRIGGQPDLLPSRLERLAALVSLRAVPVSSQVMSGPEEVSYWQGVNQFSWAPEEQLLARVPLNVARLPGLDARLEQQGWRRRYSTAGNVAWITGSVPLASLNAILVDLELPGLLLRSEPVPSGEPVPPGQQLLLGTVPDNPFARRVKQVLDPHGRFPRLA